MNQNEKIRELIDEDKEPSEKPPKQVLKENEALLLELFKLKNISQLINSNYRYKIEQLYFSYPGVHTADDAKKYLALYRVWLLLRIDETKKPIKFKKYQNPNYNSGEQLYSLASYRTELRHCEHDLGKFDAITDWRHTMKSAAGQKIRHQPKNEQYKKALMIADEKWSGGDKRIRHRMAEYLEKKFPELSHRRLQKELTPIAEKYGRNYDPKAPRKKK
jgi:hypothetical protein